MKVKLTKIASIHNNLRTDTVDGEAQDIPTLGKSFVMFAPPLEAIDGFRLVQTTPVQKIEGEGSGVRFWTKNSEYTLQYLEDSFGSDSDTAG